jgi:hypothetical protein
MEESESLLITTHKANKFKRFAFPVIIILIVVLFVAATISAAVVFSRGSDNPPPNVPPQCPQSPPPVDATNDFPLRPPQAWDINQNHTRMLNFTTNEGTW